MSKTKDIFEGDCFYVWEDDDVVFLTIHGNGVTVAIPKDHWDDVKNELSKIAET